MKRKSKIILMALSVLAVFLEILPFGAVLNFADDGTVMRKTFSYFSLIPFGYANFAPLITAILSCVLLVLSVIFFFKVSRGLKKALICISVIAFLISLCPLLSGIASFTPVACMISISLFANVVCLIFSE